MPLYEKIAFAVKKAAYELKTPIEWGGDWKSFKDGPHFQLAWSQYPEHDIEGHRSNFIIRRTVALVVLW